MLSGDPQAWLVQAKCYDVDVRDNVSEVYAFYPYSEYVSGKEFLGTHAAGNGDLLVVAPGESDADANYKTRGGLKLPVNIYNLAAFNPAGTGKFYPFGQDYELPIRVAVGDVNGDGKSEIACATGPFATPQRVKVFDSSGNFIGPEITISDPSGLRAWNGSNIATADINGDGVKEIIVAPGPAFPQAVPRGIPYLKAGPPTILIYSGVDGSLIRVLDLSRYLGASFLSGFSVAGGDVAPGSGDEIIVGVGVVGASGVFVLNGQGDLLRSFYTFTRYQVKGEIWVAAGDVIPSTRGRGKGL